MDNYIKKRAFELSKEIEKHAIRIQEYAEVGFELEKTSKYVKDELCRIGLKPESCGRCGISACIEGGGEGEVFLLRADMDALRVSDGEGKEKNMHACGHHLHTAMLLGAAEILFEMRKNINGSVRLMFQGAEEILSGASDMISCGILDSPKPSGAMMLHVMSGVKLPLGSVLVSGGGVNAPAADFFDIKIIGKGTHGALAHLGTDPISVAAYTLTALHEMSSRELEVGTVAALTVGTIHGGESANAIPDSVVMSGSLRAMEVSVREKLKQRLGDICKNIARAFGARAEIDFKYGCPPLLSDSGLSESTYDSLCKVFGKEKVKISSRESAGGMNGGSDDFSYISQRIPSVLVSVCAGSSLDGHIYPLHNPNVTFDLSVLPIGTAAYAITAAEFLKRCNYSSGE